MDFIRLLHPIWGKDAIFPPRLFYARLSSLSKHHLDPPLFGVYTIDGFSFFSSVLHQHEVSGVLIVPIYEYACEKCHEKEEVIQKFDDPAPEICPGCHAEGTLKKVVTTGAFHLKGGGWYKDLYASNKPEGSSSQKSSSTSTSEPKSDKPVKKDE